MAKMSSAWECQQCGAQSPKWAGRCPECGAWNTLVETVASATEGRRTKAEGRRQRGAAAKPQKLSDIARDLSADRRRIKTGIGELDRVLGGGLVAGEVVLLAGEPGMGKSTLLSQVALEITKDEGRRMKDDLPAGHPLPPRCAKRCGQVTDPSGWQAGGRKREEEGDTGAPAPGLQPLVLYVCGEESPSQVALRLRRLSSPSSLSMKNDARFILYPETDADAVAAEMERQAGNALVIVDSIQTMATDDLSGMAGSVGQVRECASRLSQTAKSLGVPLFLVGHVTKEGSIAGPKVLEHVVDAVLMLAGDRSGDVRMVRAVKNRFGPVDEVGLFSMDDGGMAEVKNPAELLIGEQAGKAPGSVLGCVLEGQRPLVLEVQALAVPSKLAVPRRVGHGVNERRLTLLCAVIEKQLGLGIGGKDVYVNVAGGLASSDPGLDLPVVAAIVSSASLPSSRAKSRDLATRRQAGSDINIASLDPSTPSLRSVAQDGRSAVIFCGEVGLLGEVRRVRNWERREKEMKRLGLGTLVGFDRLRRIADISRMLNDEC